MAATVTATMAVLEVTNWATIGVLVKGNGGPRTEAGVAEALIGRRWDLGASFCPSWSISGAPRGRLHFIPVCAAHSGGIWFNDQYPIGCLCCGPFAPLSSSRKASMP